MRFGIRGNNYRVLRLERLEPRDMLAPVGGDAGVFVNVVAPTSGVVGEVAVARANISGLTSGNVGQFSAELDWTTPLGATVRQAYPAISQWQTPGGATGQDTATTFYVEDKYTPTGSGSWDGTGSWTVTVTVTNNSTGGHTSGIDTFKVVTKSTIDSNTTFTASTLPDPSTNLVVTNDAILDLGGNSVVVNSLYLDDGSSVVDGSLTCTTLCQVSSGTISANLAGGPLTVIGGDTTVLSGNNTFAGTDVESGTLQAASPTALGTGPLMLNGGVLDLNSYNITVTSLSGSGGTITNSAAATTSTLTVNQGSDTTSYFYSGNIQDGAGMVALATAGDGSLTLLGTNTYSGGTNVASTLVINSAASLPQGSALTLGDPAAFAGGPTLDVQSPVSGRGASSPPAAAVPITTVTTTPAVSSAWWTTISTNTRYGQMLYFANAADTTLADMIAPADIGNHTSGEVLTALTTIFDIVLADIANNGGVRDNSQAAITAATRQVFAQYGYVVTQNDASEAAAFLANAQSFSAINQGNVLFLTILQYMANNRASGG